MSKVFWNGGALLAPVPPALVSCGTPENPNVLTIAWTGIINTKPPMTYISGRQGILIILLRNQVNLQLILLLRQCVKQQITAV